MKRYLLLMTILGLCMCSKAEKWEFSTSTFHDASFEIPEGFNCTYESSEGELRYTFMKEDSTELDFFVIDGPFDVEKVREMEDTALLSYLKDVEILNSVKVSEGNLDRVITYMEECGDSVRHYVCLFSSGIILISSFSPNGDYSEIDQIAKSVDSKSVNSYVSWMAILIYVLIASVVIIPISVLGSWLWNYLAK